jgi:hypothetical protein
MISMAFQMIYGPKERIEIKKFSLGNPPQHIRDRQPSGRDLAGKSGDMTGNEAAN